MSISRYSETPLLVFRGVGIKNVFYSSKNQPPTFWVGINEQPSFLNDSVLIKGTSVKAFFV